MRIYKSFQKVVVLCVIAAFLFPSYGYGVKSVPAEEKALKAVGDGFRGAPAPVDLKKIIDIDVPANFGAVTERFEGPSDKVIIHIQDIHCNFEAQKNLATILKGLKASEFKNDLKLIAVEGATGNIDLSPFDPVTHTDIRELISRYFVRNGFLTGSEYYALFTKDPMEIYGVDNEDLYIGNYVYFLNAQYYKKGALKEIGKAKKILSLLQRKVFGPDMLELSLRSEGYEDGDIKLTGYCGYLKEAADKAGIDHRRYDDFSAVINSIDLDRSIDKQALKSERKAFVKALQMGMDKDGVSELVKMSLFFRTGRTPTKRFYSYLISAAEKIRLDMSPYENLLKYTEMVKLHDRISSNKLFSEINLLLDDIKAKVIKTGDEKKLDGLIRDVSIARKLVDLKLNRGELEYFKEHENEISGKRIYKELNSMALKYELPGEVDPAIAGITDHISECEGFYDAAVKRDKAVAENTLGRMKDNDLDAAIVVTGGFHSKGVIDIFRKKGISYVVIQPRMTASYDPGVYMARMMNEQTSFERLLASAGTRLSPMDYFATSPYKVIRYRIPGTDEVTIIDPAGNARLVGEMISVLDKALVGIVKDGERRTDVGELIIEQIDKHTAGKEKEDDVVVSLGKDEKGEDIILMVSRKVSALPSLAGTELDRKKEEALKRYESALAEGGKDAPKNACRELIGIGKEYIGEENYKEAAEILLALRNDDAVADVSGYAKDLLKEIVIDGSDESFVEALKLLNDMQDSYVYNSLAGAGLLDVRNMIDSGRLTDSDSRKLFRYGTFDRDTSRVALLGVLGVRKNTEYLDFLNRRERRGTGEQRAAVDSMLSAYKKFKGFYEMTADFFETNRHFKGVMNRLRDYLVSLYKTASVQDKVEKIFKAHEHVYILNFATAGLGARGEYGVKDMNDRIFKSMADTNLVIDARQRILDEVAREVMTEMREKNDLMQISLQYKEDKYVVGLSGVSAEDADALISGAGKRINKLLKERIDDYMRTSQEEAPEKYRRYCEENGYIRTDDKGDLAGYTLSYAVFCGVARVESKGSRGITEADAKATQAGRLARLTGNQAFFFDFNDVKGQLEMFMALLDVLKDSGKFTLEEDGTYTMDEQLGKYCRDWLKFKGAEGGEWSRMSEGLPGDIDELIVEEVDRMYGKNKRMPSYNEFKDKTSYAVGPELYYYVLAKHYFDIGGTIDYIKTESLQTGPEDTDSIISFLNMFPLDVGQAKVEEMFRMVREEPKYRGVTSAPEFFRRSVELDGAVITILDIINMGGKNNRSFQSSIQRFMRKPADERSSGDFVREVLMTAGDDVTKGAITDNIEKIRDIMNNRLIEAKRAGVIKKTAAELSADQKTKLEGYPGKDPEEQLLNKLTAENDIMLVGGDELTFTRSKQFWDTVNSPELGLPLLHELQNATNTRVISTVLASVIRDDKRGRDIGQAVGMIKLDDGTAVAKELEALGLKNFVVEYEGNRWVAKFQFDDGEILCRAEDLVMFPRPYLERIKAQLALLKGKTAGERESARKMILTKINYDVISSNEIIVDLMDFIGRDVQKRAAREKLNRLKKDPRKTWNMFFEAADLYVEDFADAASTVGFARDSAEPFSFDQQKSMLENILGILRSKTEGYEDVSEMLTAIFTGTLTRYHLTEAVMDYYGGENVKKAERIVKEIAAKRPSLLRGVAGMDAVADWDNAREIDRLIEQSPLEIYYRLVSMGVINDEPLEEETLRRSLETVDDKLQEDIEKCGERLAPYLKSIGFSEDEIKDIMNNTKLLNLIAQGYLSASDDGVMRISLGQLKALRDSGDLIFAEKILEKIGDQAPVAYEDYFPEDTSIEDLREWAEGQEITGDMVVYVAARDMGRGKEIGNNMTRAVYDALVSKDISVDIVKSRIFLTQNEFESFYDLNYILDNFVNVVVTNERGVQKVLSEKDKEILRDLKIETTGDVLLILPEVKRDKVFYDKLMKATSITEFQA
ncbi:hypothetical protein ACFLQ8_01115 [Candidatus Auribacterota bacterium]